MRMSDPRLDDLLRTLGDHGLDPDRDPAVSRVRRRLLDDLNLADGPIAGRSAVRVAPGRRSRVLAVLTATVAAAATFTATAAVALTVATGSPVPGFARGDTTNVFPDPGTTRITDARSPDPTGGLPWGVRVGRTGDGLVCVGAGQIGDGGAFGVRGLDGRFRLVGSFGNDSCGPAPGKGRPLVQFRGFSGPGSRSATGATSVVFGSGGPDLKSVRIATAGGTDRRVRVGSSGTFVLAVAGLPEGAAPEVRLRWTGGVERTVRLGRDSSLPDPAGLVGWGASTSYSGPEGCTVVSILRVQESGGAKVCGSLTGPQATLVPVGAMHGVGKRLALLVRRDDGDRVVVRRDGRDVPIVTVRMAGRMRDSIERVVSRDRSGRARVVERTVQRPASGPTASLAILPAGVRAEDLEVQAIRANERRTLQVRSTSPESSKTSPGGR